MRNVYRRHWTWAGRGLAVLATSAALALGSPVVSAAPSWPEGATRADVVPGPGGLCDPRGPNDPREVDDLPAGCRHPALWRPLDVPGPGGLCDPRGPNDPREPDDLPPVCFRR